MTSQAKSLRALWLLKDEPNGSTVTEGKSMRIKGIDGLPVLDAKKPVTLIITDRDVAGSNTKSPTNCAAARACARQLHLEARVHLGRIYLKTAKDRWTRFETPKSLRTEIIAFDRGGSFEPGEYELRPMHASKRIGKGGYGSETSRTKPRPRNQKPRRSPTIVKDVRTGPA